ncbi:MAG TPA: hypothetical protein VNA69_05495 [Thermoanaerobaculia bacterium]|nr:hypothetical protein [Thermoanaerobaculia bacterium]
MGEAVLPEVPTYHWYDNGVVPDAPTERVVLLPDVIVVDTGCEVIEAGVQVGPHEPPGYTACAAF